MRLAHYHCSHKAVTSINMGKSDIKSPTVVFEQTSDRFATNSQQNHNGTLGNQTNSEYKYVRAIIVSLVSRRELLKQNYQNADSNDLHFKQSIDVTILTFTLLHRGISTRDTEQQNE